MARRGENIYKRKDGRWEGRYIKSYSESGKAKYGYLYAHTYKEVKHRLQNVGTDIVCNCKRKSKLYEDRLNEWLEITKPNVKYSTFIRYKKVVEKHISKHFGSFNVERIDTMMIEEFIGIKLQDGLSAKTVSDILLIIKSSLRYAEAEGEILNCSLSKISVKAKKPEMRVLSAKEEKALINFLLQETDYCKLGVYLCLYSGIRIGELCALKWEDIDLNGGCIHIHHTMQRVQNDNLQKSKTSVIITDAKTSSSDRHIPVVSFLSECLKKFKCEDKCYFLTGSSEKYVEPRTMQNRFKNYLKQVGIDDANFHSLRHTFSTRCVEAGVDIKTLSEILAHTSVKITLDRYVHSSFELKKANIEKLCKL